MYLKKASCCRVVLLLCLGGVGCSTTQQIQAPFTLDKLTDRAKINLETPAQIVVTQKVKGSVKNCQTLKNHLKVRIKSVKTEKYQETATGCPENGIMILETKKEQPKGLYMIDVSLEPADALIEAPTIAVRYPNPDFKSGPDQLPSGAKDLAQNQSIKGAVNYSAGMTTTWFKLKGKKSNVALTLLGDGDANDLNAQVYQFTESAKTPSLIGRLYPRRKDEFKLGENDVYVKITGNEFSGEQKFSLVRRDIIAVRKVRVNVIDVYSINDATSVALLKPSSALKVDSEVSLFGKRSTGETVSVGKCTVTSVGEAQVSCHLDQPKPTNMVEYRAETNVGGQS